MPPQTPPPPTQSQILPSGFRVIDWLGTGTFGKVCKAQLGQGGFECAFKIIELTREKAQGLKEFRAIRIIRRVKPHRNLLEYLGVWLRTADGEFLDNVEELEDTDLARLDVTELFIQMPLALKSLEVRLKECQREFKKNAAKNPPGLLPGIPLAELLPYMRGVAEALDHLHSPIHPLTDRGLGWIMHRDIKPANLLIDRTGDVLVADYGVARAVGANVRGTQTGAGTPIYTPPEQFTKKVEVVDPASDQYSLAISYFEMRTGSLPFKDDVRIELNDLKRAHILGRLDFSKLLAAEQEVLKQATCRTVSKRYSSCVVFVDELWKAHGRMPQPNWTTPPPTAPVDPPSAVVPVLAMGTRPKTGSRTSIDLGTTPETSDASATPPTRPSGTLVLGDTIRPVFGEAVLPLAEPIEDAAASPWKRSGKEKKKTNNAVWYVAASMALAAAVGAAAYFVSPGPKDGGTTEFASGTPVVPDSTASTTVEPKKIEGGGTTSIVIPKTVPTPTNYASYVSRAQEVFGGVIGRDLAKINEGLKTLESIPEPDRSAVARDLKKAWEDAKAALEKDTPTLVECETLANWKAPAGLTGTDVEPLRQVYANLREKHPTAEVRFIKARSAYENGKNIAAGTNALKELLNLKPDMPTSTNAEALFKAWNDAEAFDKTVSATAKEPVALAAFKQPREALAKLDTLHADDRKDISNFYRVRLDTLVQRFALAPSLDADAASWSGLNEKLPTKDELGSAAPWLELLRVESDFLAKRTPTAEFPSRPKPENKELLAYYELVRAEWKWSSAVEPQSRRDAATALLKAIPALPKESLVEARRRAFGQVLAQAVPRQKATALDTAYADENSIALARESLSKSLEFLPRDENLRGRLLLASAFPRSTAIPKEVAAIDSKSLVEIAKTFDEKERQALTLAFARTRDWKDATGIKDALEGYEKTVTLAIADLNKPDAEIAFAKNVASYLRERAFIEAIPAERRKAAGENLFLPLARQFFQRRQSLKPEERVQFVSLAGRAADLTGSADVEALAGIYAIEAAVDSLDEANANHLNTKGNSSAATLAYLGLVQSRKAQTKKDAEKLTLLESGGKNLLDAIKLNSAAKDPEKILDLLYPDAATAFLELGKSYETGKKYQDAVVSFTQVIELAKDRPDLSALANSTRLPRGRSQWTLAKSATDPILATAKADLENAASRRDPNFAEARYLLALIEIYKSGFLYGGAPTNYEAGKANLCSPSSTKLDADKLKLLSNTFDDLPAEKSAFALELQEWKACLACARANAENALSNEQAREASRGSAFASLQELAKLDPLAAELRRTQFLSYRLQIASDRKNDPELQIEAFKELWSPPQTRIHALQQLSESPPRLAGSPLKDRALFEMFVLHATAHSLLVPELKNATKVAQGSAYLEAMAKLDSKAVTKAEVVAAIEEVGMQAAQSAYKFEKQEDGSLSTALANLAAESFLQSGRLDESFALHAAHYKGDPVNTAAFRSYVARRLGLQIDVVEIKKSPEKQMDLLVRQYTIFYQAKALLSQKDARSAKDNADIKSLDIALADLRTKLLEPYLDTAIDAIAKTDPAKAKEWRDWKAKRLKPE